MPGQAYPMREGNSLPDGEVPDDVDRVYARLTQLPPPRGFSANVMLAVRGARDAQAIEGQAIERVRTYRLRSGQVQWALAELAVLFALGLVAFLVGQALVGGGALDLLGALAGDADVLLALPGVALLAFVEAFPWLESLGLLALLALLGFCTRRLGRALAGPEARGVRARRAGAA